jgi:hypothetical protein
MKVTLKPMKKAIVLLMTIGFITLITALVLFSLSISKKSFDEVVYLDARNQFNIVFKDFVSKLKVMSKQMADNSQFDIPPIPVTDPKTGITFSFGTESLMGRLNVNYLLDKIVKDVNDENRTILELPLKTFFSKLELKEQQLLIDIMLDTIDKDDLERGAYSEISAENPDFREGKIYSYNHLSKIFEHYYKVSKDINIYKMDKDTWEENFYFGDMNSSHQLLDCDELDYNNVANLITDNRYANSEDVDFCSEFNQSDPYYKKLKNIYNIKPFDKKREYLLQCSIVFNTENFKRNVTFDYELKTTRIGNIDKNFQE